MEPRDQLRFAVSDRIDEIEVGPEHVPLSLIGEFQKDVSEFLRGSNREVDTTKVIVSIQPGSLAFVASGLLAASALWRDLGQLNASTSLAHVDQKRGAVLARWQSAARANPNRKYKLVDSSGQAVLDIDFMSTFEGVDNVWVHVEKYLHGKIMDMGGKTRPNVHIELENGQSLKISASQEQLAQGEKNRLYRDELLHVAAEENLVTGELRNMHLIAFEPYHPRYDEDEFRLMVDRGTEAWAGTDDDWVENIRGGKA